MTRTTSISDLEIVEWMDAGILVYDEFRQKFCKYHKSRKRFEPLTPAYNRGRAFVNLRAGSIVHPRNLKSKESIGRLAARQRKIYLNRLMFLWTHRREPDGFVDHRDGDKTNDSPSNLREQSPADSNRQGYEKQLEANLQSWREFFDFIAFMGYAPPEGHVLWR